MKESILKVSNLSHKYESAWAIKDINFEIADVGIMGLLGSNGAGKSTVMNIVCGAIKQTQGQVILGGIDLLKYPEQAKRHIGFLPQNPPLLLDLTVDEYLTYAAVLRLMDQKDISKALARVKDECGIAHISSRLLKNLSGGYRQRVGIAQAIIHSPALVVLDEPTNGLDPNQILEVRRLIKKIGEERSVIFSSHILSEIKATCEQVKMIEQGKMVYSGSMDSFYNYIEPDSLLVVLENPPSPDELLDLPGVREVEFIDRKQIRIKFEGRDTITETVIKASLENAWRLQEVVLERSSLDEVFAQLTKQSHD